jgi:hypothetical protein
MDDRETADVLSKELVLFLGERGGPDPGADAEWPCRLYWAACEATEAVRIMETHRRKSGLSREQLAALEFYRQIYEHAELALLVHFPYPHARPPPPEL